ncbi:MAG TPA: hypothetical protein VFI88_03095 [Sphingomicrobium sp.]|jgi:hypothetical protein|nr:hypothetical protein [Sphingomicrobium sp.]
MPNRIDRGYLRQGYRLPLGFTWDKVAQLRERWDSPDIFVPAAAGAGCLGWGVPFVDGAPLEHP